MKKAILMSILAMVTLAGFAPERKTLIIQTGQRIDPYAKIWEAVKWVETRNRDTINYHEQAYGRGQIRRDKLKDYNKANGTKYRLTDCMNEKTSKKIFYWHMRQYDDKMLAVRRWNGSGPKSYEYLNKVKKRLNSAK